jgi:hypothetical protein
MAKLEGGEVLLGEGDHCVRESLQKFQLELEGLKTGRNAANHTHRRNVTI